MWVSGTWYDFSLHSGKVSVIVSVLALHVSELINVHGEALTFHGEPWKASHCDLCKMFIHTPAK